MKRIILLMLISTVYATNGYLQTGYGVKSKGMGGVGVALPQDSFASAMNPAGIALLRNRFDVGIHWLQLKGTFKEGPPSTSRDLPFKRHSEENMYWPELGVIWHPCCDMALGFAVYAVGGFKVDYPKTDTLPELKTDYQVYNITPSWAWKVNECHSVGVAFNIAYALFESRGLDPAEFPSVAPNYLTGHGNTYQQGLGFRLGWRGQLCSNFAVGVTYQSKTWMNHYSKYRGFFADNGNFDLPSQWGFGFEYQPISCFTIAIDVIRVQWTDVKMLDHDSQRVGNYGGRNGKGLGWCNEWIVKVGLAWQINECFTVRGGWNYGDQIFGGPENKINRLTLADVEHLWSIGATYTFLGCNEISINYIHGHNHTQEFYDRAATDQSRARTITKAHQNSIGISYGRKF